jgi:hypothetical protein
MPEQNDDEESEEGGMKVCLCPEPVLAKHTLAVSLRRPEMNRDEEKNETIYLFFLCQDRLGTNIRETPKSSRNARC